MASPKETLAKMAADHYHWLIHQVPARQDNLFRTYLWLASLALTIAVYFFKDAPPPPLSVTASLLYCSIAFALFAIAFCLFHMRGKFNFQHPNLKEYSAKMTGSDEETFLTYLIEQYWDLSHPGKVQMVQRSRSLRVTTWVLTLCFVFLALAGILSIPASHHSAVTKGGTSIMAEEQSNQTASPDQKPPAAPQQPEKPAPSSDYVTHGDHAAGVQTFESDLQKRSK